MGARQGIEAGLAFIRLTINDEQAAKKVEAFSSRMDKVAGRLAAVGTRVAALGAAITAPFALGVKNALEFTRALELSSRRLGVSVQELGRLQIVGEQFGVTLEGVEIAVKTLGERLFQLEGGATETARALQQIGVSASDFINSNTLDRFLLIADGLQSIEDSGRRAGLGLALLGESGFATNAMLAMGSAGLEAAANQARLVGPTKEAAENVAKLWNELVLARHAFRNLTVDLASTIMPLLTTVTRLFKNIVIEVRFLNAEMPVLAKSIALVGVALTGLGGGLLFGAGGAKLLSGAGKLITAIRSLFQLKALKLVFTHGWKALRVLLGGVLSLSGAIGSVAAIAITMFPLETWFAVTKVLGAIKLVLLEIAEIGVDLARLFDKDLFTGLKRQLVKLQNETRGKLYESFSEFKDRRANRSFGEESDFSRPPGLGRGAAFTAVGVGGTFANAQTLGYAGYQGPLDKLNNTAEEQLREQVRIRKAAEEGGRIKP